MRISLFKVPAIIVVGAFLLFASPGFALNKVTLQLPWEHQFNFAGYYMAKEKGFYRDADLDVELLDVEKGLDAVEEVVSGRADFGISGSGLLIKRSQGAPVVVVASIFQRNPTVLVTLKSSAIRTPKDLIGRKVMLPPGSRASSLIALLHHEGVLEQIERVDGNGLNLDDLVSGRVDAIKAYRTNDVFVLQNKGYEYHVINPEDYGIDFLGDTLFTSEREALQRPEVIERFRKASIKGWEYALEHREEAISVILNRYPSGKTVEQLRFEAEEIFRVIDQHLVPVGTTGLSRWAQVTHYLIAIGQIPSTFHIPDNFIFSPPQKTDWAQLAPFLIGMFAFVALLLAIVGYVINANRHLRLAQAKIEANECKYRDVINHQNDVLLLHKVIPEGYATFSDVNDAAVKFYGYAREELLQMSPYDVVVPEIIDEMISSGRRNTMLETGELFVESVHITKSGERVPVDVSASIVEIEGEKYILSNVRDIRERKETEKAMRESEQKFRLLADYTSDWEYWVDQEGQYLYVSPACEVLTGYSSDEFIKDPLLFPRLIQDEKESAHFSQEKRDETSEYRSEFQIRTRSGELRWIEHSCRQILDGDGKSLGRRGNNRDISKRKQAEETFEILFKEGVGGLVLADAETGEVIECNDAMAQMIEWTPEELIGKTQAIWHREEEVEGGISKGFDETRQGDFSKIRHETFVTKSGKHIDVEIKAKPPILNSRRVLLGMMTDISERNEMENQLRQKHKMEAVGYMAGGMAHNFNNNLSIILGNLELALISQPPESPLIPLLSNAKTAVFRSRDLVNKIITYSRQGIQEKSHVLLADIIKETVDLLSVAIPTTIEISQDIDSECRDLAVHADASQIQEVLINLCNNAVDAMDERGQLAIRLARAELSDDDVPAQFDIEPGHFVKVSVQDDGCGMSPLVQEKIFDPFFTTKGEFEGAGMGLATVQGIVVQHGGLIKVDSVAGQGTTFNLYFPAVEADVVREQVDAGDPVVGQGEKILLVDDEQLVADITKNMLKKNGYQVTVMNDSVEALKCYSVNHEHFDLLFTDQVMPGLTGVELIEKCRNIRPDLPTILMTGFSTKIDEKEASERGVGAFVMKPVDMHTMLETLRTVLDAS